MANEDAPLGSRPGGVIHLDAGQAGVTQGIKKDKVGVVAVLDVQVQQLIV